METKMDLHLNILLKNLSESFYNSEFEFGQLYFVYYPLCNQIKKINVINLVNCFPLNYELSYLSFCCFRTES